MKYLKKYENFVTDDNRGEESMYPEKNQALKHEISEYVDSILNSNDFGLMYELVGKKMPKDVNGEELNKSFDEVRELAIEYLLKHPEEVSKDGYKMSTFTVGSNNDGISRTNNVGGALRESNRPMPNDLGTSLLDISDDEMSYFETEGPLIDLIRYEKVVLLDNEVWYNDDDDDTIDVLETYFKM